MKKLWKIMVTDRNYSFFNYLNNEGNEDNRTLRLSHLTKSSDGAMKLTSI